ncbi:gene transfer agent family protein [Rhodovulum sp. DZ06]|uniref:gene transfer agent family protein n=1 Tax=Rhodovulum sp. DZ06 TaxID=3425126 RepID=UPI003D3299AE
MANAMRGDARIVLGGEARGMRLTLGALAELEDALGAECLADLVARFEGGGVRARDLVLLIGAGLRGAGAEISDDELAGMEVGGGAAGAARAAAVLLSRTFAPLGDGE